MANPAMTQPETVAARVLSETGEPLAVLPGAPSLVDLLGSFVLAFDLQIESDLDVRPQGLLIHRRLPSEQAKPGIMRFRRQTSDFKPIWHTNIIYRGESGRRLEDVRIPDSYGGFGAEESLQVEVRKGDVPVTEGHVVQLDLVVFHDGRSSAISPPGTQFLEYQAQSLHARTNQELVLMLSHGKVNPEQLKLDVGKLLDDFAQTYEVLVLTSYPLVGGSGIPERVNFPLQLRNLPRSTVSVHLLLALEPDRYMDAVRQFLELLAEEPSNVDQALLDHLETQAREQLVERYKVIDLSSEERLVFSL